MAQTVRFESRPLPEPVAVDLRARLARAHWSEPFSTRDPRATVRRVLVALEGFSVHATVFRGGVDLRGAEVDHVWVALARPAGSDGGEHPYVLDAAFPLHRAEFIAVLRRYVAGEADSAELDAAAAHAGLDERVLGRFPADVAYLGSPVWAPGRM